MSSSICIPNMILLACKVAEKSLTKKCYGITEGRTDGRTDRMTDRCKPVYPPLFQRGGIIRLDVSSESSAKQRIHIKNQALFSLKEKSKKLKCHLLQFLFGTLRVNRELNYLRMNYRFKKITLFHCMSFRYLTYNSRVAWCTVHAMLPSNHKFMR